MKNLFYLLVFLVAFPLLDARAADMVSVSANRGQETITIAVPDISSHKVFTVPAPDRLVIDVPSVPGKPHPSLPSSYRGSLIKEIRYGQFTPETSRFVFDLNEPIRVISVDEKDGAHPRLVVTITSEGGPSESVSAEEPEKKPETKAPPKKKPIQEAKKFEPPKHEAKKPRKSEKPLIAIDPGHGGVDPGTIGTEGTQEKDITLAFAQALKARLLKTGRYRVMLTRDSDDFIMLRQRVALARKTGASLFISIHADSAPDEVRGLSVYTVSEKASDKETEALAAQENKADVLAGMDLTDEQQDVAGILISLAERDTMNRSATFADLVVTSLNGKVRLLPNSHRFAGFAVLKAPDIPSVLIETGFLSEPQEEKLLATKSYRDKVTASIAAAVDAYFRHQKEMGEP